MASHVCSLLRPPQFVPDVTECGHILGMAGDIAWSGELRGDTRDGGEEALGVEREGDRADFLQARLTAL